MINENNLTINDIENLIDYYCSDCCRNCDECSLRDFNNELYYTIESYNKTNN